jgi:hypothetical protein
MFRKLILSAVAATGIVGGLTATPATAAAQLPLPYGPHHPHHVHYVVLVRHHGHWDQYASFQDHHDARRAVWHLERQGYDARIDAVHRSW